MARDQESALVALMPRLRRFGIALTGSASDAEFLVQSACKRMLLSEDRFRSDGQIRAWMYRIMRKLWIEAPRDPRAEQEDALETHGVIGDDGEVIAESDVRPATVRRALAELPERQRTALVLICVDNMSYKKTAAILDIPIGAMTNLVAGARAALHRQIIMQSTGVGRSPITSVHTDAKR